MPDYIPATAKQQKQILAAVGVGSMAELFAAIPPGVRLNEPLALPEPLAELELSELARQIAARNQHTLEKRCFLGAGSYDHYRPAAIDYLISRQEFMTAYTPYQPEISQGTLQAIFEYQSMICQLTGLDVANASLYDGASALAEAALVALQATRHKKILAARSLHPDAQAVLQTYARFSDFELEWLDFDPASGSLSVSALKQQLDDQTAGVIVQYPNFYGIIEPLSQISAVVHEKGAKFIVSCDPIALGLLRSPGEAGADIAVGDGQSLGNSMSYGGPSLGFFAARQDLMRRIPGRIVGETVDARGQRRFVLTLQTREQHIRREKATSNICTNQGLNALIATIYLSLMGPEGLSSVAQTSARQAHKLYDRLLSCRGFSPVFKGDYFKEFTLRFDGDLAALNEHLDKDGFIGGLPLALFEGGRKDVWLLAATEKRVDRDIDDFILSVERFTQTMEADK